MADSREKALSYVLEIGSLRLEAGRVQGFEAMSRPYRFELGLTTDGTYDADPDRFLRSDVVLDILRGARVQRRIRGIATEVRLSASSRGRSSLTMVIEPRFALMRHRVDMRVFRDRTVPQIASELLGEQNIPFEQRLSRTYAPLPYSVQYRESALDFVSRLFEDEGIHYFFDEEGTLILGDATNAYGETPGGARLPFVMGSGLDANRDAITSLEDVAELSVGKVTLRDYDLARPRLDLEVSAPGPSAVGPEQYEYPGEYVDPEVGAQRAAARSEAYRCTAQRLVGTSFCGRLLPGHSFELTEAPASFGDQELVVMRVDHGFGLTDAGFSMQFEALPKSRVFRPLPETPRPEIDHVMPAMVVGPKDVDIHTDSLGRVKVRFPWDRRSSAADPSDWVPVIQDNTGHSVHIPRTGWEVLTSFIDGDPDRPVVMGRLYNAREPAPEPLPENKTVSSMRSLSSPGRGGSSSIRIDDRAGAEAMHVHAERDQDVLVANERREDITQNGNVEIGGDETIRIAGNLTVAVGGDAQLDVSGSRTETIGAAREVKISKAEEVVVKGDHKIRIGGTSTRRIRTDDVVSAAAITEKVGIVDLEVSLGKNSLAAKKGGSITVGGVIVEVSRGDKSEQTKLARAETIGALVLSKSAMTKIEVKKNKTTRVGGSLRASSAGTIELNGSSVRLASKADGIYAASSIVLQVNKTKVTLSGGVMKIEAADIIFESKGQADLHQNDSTLV